MGDTFPRYTVAAVQAAPVFLDREATVAKACRLIGEAAELGARLIVFPEVFVAGYPYWLWGNRPDVEQQAFADLWQEAIDIPGPTTEAIGAAAKTARAHVLIGVNERESAHGRGTLYNTLLTIGPDGTLLRRHRKLVPTYKERTVWGQGDAGGLGVEATPLGRIGGLICWENYMPLARYSLYADGVHVYAAVTVEDSPTWQNLVRTIAAEGRVFVVSVCQLFSRTHFPNHAYLAGFPPETDVLSGGGSVVVAPDGAPIAGPLHGEEGILTAEIDLRRVVEGKHSLDVTGHYARPDVFTLSVDRLPRPPIHVAEIPRPTGVPDLAPDAREDA